MFVREFFDRVQFVRAHRADLFAPLPNELRCGWCEFDVRRWLNGRSGE